MTTFVEYVVANAGGITEETFAGLADHLATAESIDVESMQALLDTFFDEQEPLVPVPKPKASKGKGKGTAAKTTPGKLYILTDCPTKAGKGNPFHCIFGNTANIKEKLNALNDFEGWPKIVVYNASFKYGAGWRISDEARLSEVTDMFDAEGLEYEIVTAEEYEAVRDSLPTPGKGTGKAKVPPKGKGAGKATAPKAPGKGKGVGKAPAPKGKGAGKAKVPAKGKGVAKAPAPKTMLSAVENDWHNLMHVDTSIVFVKMPVGTNGKEIGIAVGIQDLESQEDGLASVIPLDEETIKVCEDNKFMYLDEARLAALETANPEQHTELVEWMNAAAGDADATEGGDEAEGDADAEGAGDDVVDADAEANE